MNAATLDTVIKGVEAAIMAAPTVVAVAQKGKELIGALFEAGEVSSEEQNALRDHIDKIQEAALAGEEPPHWQVEPDPE